LLEALTETKLKTITGASAAGFTAYWNSEASNHLDFLVANPEAKRPAEAVKIVRDIDIFIPLINAFENTPANKQAWIPQLEEAKRILLTKLSP
jgi:hypothetical protein